MELKTIFHLFAVFFIIVGIGLYITNAVFTFNYKTYNFDTDKIISRIQKSLNSKFIYKFEGKPNCDKNEERLNLGIWHGSYDKCDCDGNVLNRICTFNNETTCTSSIGQNSKYFTKIGGKEICVTRKGDTYMDLIKAGKIISKSQNCTDTYKSCGIVDTLGRKLCVTKEEECPINANNIRKHPPGPQILSQFTSNQFLDNNEMYFLDEENDEEKVISEVKISDDFPCLDFSEFHWVAYHPDEKIKSFNCSTINGNTTDDRYEKFDNYHTDKQKLYTENGLSDFITEELKKDKTTINLYGATILGIDLKEDGFNYDNLISSQNLANKCNSVMLVITIIGFCALIFPIIGTFRTCNNKDSENDRCLVIIFTIGVISICLTFLVDFILCIIIAVQSKKINGLLIGDSGISDEITNEMLKSLLSELSSNYSFALALIIVIIIFIILAIITAILYKKK